MSFRQGEKSNQHSLQHLVPTAKWNKLAEICEENIRPVDSAVTRPIAELYNAMIDGNSDEKSQKIKESVDKWTEFEFAENVARCSAHVHTDLFHCTVAIVYHSLMDSIPFLLLNPRALEEMTIYFSLTTTKAALHCVGIRTDIQ